MRELLSYLRGYRNVTREEVASMLGVSYNTITLYFKKENIALNKLKKLAEKTNGTVYFEIDGKKIEL